MLDFYSYKLLFYIFSVFLTCLYNHVFVITDQLYQKFHLNLNSPEVLIDVTLCHQDFSMIISLSTL